MAAKKRVVLNLDEKIAALNRLDKGIPAYKVAEEFKVGKTQIQSLRKRREEVLKDFAKNVPGTTKRKRHFTGNEEINELTLAWFKDAVTRGVNVNGPLLQFKALEFAKGLDIEGFKASKGWLDSFKTRHNLTYGKMSGARGDVNEETVEDWKSKLPELCEGFDSKDIFNMDETGLLFRDTTRYIFYTEGDDCADDKISEERITIALCASLEGEKIKPLVIGKSRNPPCFKAIKKEHLPVYYYNNTKALMSTTIYEDYVKKINQKMRLENRHILLFVDNALSHPVMNLSNITIKFLPNTTSYTQPMDQGIIQATKLKFRKRQLKHMVKEMDNQPAVPGPSLLKQLNVLDAIYWISNSWKEVEESNIQKCFFKAGFTRGNTPISDENFDEPEQEEIPSALKDRSNDIFGCSFDDLLSIDKDLSTCQIGSINWDKSPKELVNELLKNGDDDEEDDSDGVDEDTSSPTTDIDVPTLHEANKMVSQLKAFALHHGQSEIMNLISEVDEHLSNMSTYLKRTKQTDFFHSTIVIREKPFTCDICHKSFAQLGALKRHTVIHTGERPYQCQICLLLFAHDSTLRAHEKIHKKEALVEATSVIIKEEPLT